MKTKTKFKQTEIGMIPEGWEYGTSFVRAVSDFLRREKFLLEKNLNERTISHKLAEYLQKEFSKHDVDCEYNRMKKSNLTDEYVTKILGLTINEISSSDTTAKTVYPDIIIHKRGDNEENIIVIEIKKKTNNESKEFDYDKLKAFTKQLEYEFGIYLEFGNSSVTEIKFFRNGVEMT